jgi:hypothetical protein
MIEMGRTHPDRLATPGGRYGDDRTARTVMQTDRMAAGVIGRRPSKGNGPSGTPSRHVLGTTQ